MGAGEWETKEGAQSNLRSLLRSIDAPPLGAGGTDDLGGATTSTWIGGKRYDAV